MATECILGNKIDCVQSNPLFDLRNSIEHVGEDGTISSFGSILYYVPKYVVNIYIPLFQPLRPSMYIHSTIGNSHRFSPMLRCPPVRHNVHLRSEVLCNPCFSPMIGGARVSRSP